LTFKVSLFSDQFGFLKVGFAQKFLGFLKTKVGKLENWPKKVGKWPDLKIKVGRENYSKIAGKC
jgi:hypothetical protein